MMKEMKQMREMKNIKMQLERRRPNPSTTTKTAQKILPGKTTNTN